MSTPLTETKRTAARAKARKNRQNEYGFERLSGCNRFRTYWSSAVTNSTDDVTDEIPYGYYRSVMYTPHKILPPPVVLDAPSELPTREYKIDHSKMICFSGRQNFLSTLYPVTLEVRGEQYPTVEHYYQKCKLEGLGNENLARKLNGIREAGKAKVLSKKLLIEAGVSQQKIDEWKSNEAPLLLYHALMHKFTQHKKLAYMLLDTGDAILAHAYDHENVFATGCSHQDVIAWAQRHHGTTVHVPICINHETITYVPLIGEGKNLLGFLNMKVREKLRDLLEAHKESDPDLSTFETLRLE